MAFLESIPHTTTVNFLIADLTGEIALVEASPERVRTTHPSDGLVSVTNQFVSESMRAYQSTDRSPTDCPRLQALEAWFDDQEQPITLEDLHAVSAIVEPIRGFEEALIRVPVMTSNDVVSVSTPEVDAVRILAFSPANEGLHPMVLDQQLLDASEPGDMGLSRWTRVIGMVAAEPPDPVREHLEVLIEQSPEIPEIG